LCPERCANDEPQAAALARAVTECVALACDLEADWSCVGSVTWPKAMHESIALQVRVFDYANQSTSLPGVLVKACAVESLSCETPLDSAITDMHGEADLVVSTINGPFTGFVEISGANLHTLLNYFYPPLTQKLKFNTVALKEAEYLQVVQKYGAKDDAT